MATIEQLAKLAESKRLLAEVTAHVATPVAICLMVMRGQFEAAAWARENYQPWHSST